MVWVEPNHPNPVSLGGASPTTYHSEGRHLLFALEFNHLEGNLRESQRRCHDENYHFNGGQTRNGASRHHIGGGASATIISDGRMR